MEVTAQSRVVRMRFRDPMGGRGPSFMHIGGDLKGLENVSPVLHSDTLFSAICHAWVDCYGASDLERTLLQGLRDEGQDPPFRVSSAFLFRTSHPNLVVHYVPRPLLPLPGQGNRSPEVRGAFLKYAQRLKSTDYVTLFDLLRWLQWEEHEDDTAYEQFYTSLIEEAKTWSTVWIPHLLQANEVSRETGQTNTFTRGVARLDDHQEPGYYFLITYAPHAVAEGLPTRMDDVLTALAELGIGGERSLGLGRWQFDCQDLLDPYWKDLLALSPTRHLVYLLSLYYPTAAELTGLNVGECRYRLIPRKGWFDSPTGYQLKRQSCRMLGEGSLLRMANGRLPRGTLVDVSPQKWQALKDELKDRWHPIYRSGVALSVLL